MDPTTNAQFPLRLARNYTYSHQQTVEGIAADFGAASAEGWFVIDVAWCGNETGKFIAELNGKGLLTERTVLVGVAHLDADSQKLLQERETAVVWSPTRGSVSFEFATNKHMIALGTDGTGNTSLADEIQATMKMGLPPEAIYSMVTARAAGILRLRNGEGRIVADTPADILAVTDSGATPAQALCAGPASPAAVIVGGRPLLVHAGSLERLPESLRDPLRAFTVGDTQWWAEEHLVAAVRGAHRSGQKIRMAGELVKA
jgi:imidazolonepropionase-like amidohydrolase